MDQWKTALEKGKIFLSRHEPYKAVGCFERALKVCPVNNPADLSSVLFYLGITLKKLGEPSGAIRSWTAAAALRKTGYSSRMVKRYMDAEKADWKAFCGIQIHRYQKSKRSGKISTEAEKDMVYDLLSSYWQEIVVSGILLDKNMNEKIAVFHEIQVIFPHFDAAQLNTMNQEDIKNKIINFPENRIIGKSG